MSYIKKLVYSNIALEESRQLRDKLSISLPKGVTSFSDAYNQKTKEFVFVIKVDVEELPAQKGEQAEVADISAAIEAKEATKVLKVEDVTDGSAGMTARDRGRQFLQAVADDIDPIFIGVDGPTLEARKETLRSYAKASQRHFNLPDVTRKA